MRLRLRSAKMSASAFADLAHALRRQLVATPRLADEAGVLQHLCDLLQLLELLALLLAEEIADAILVDVGGARFSREHP